MTTATTTQTPEAKAMIGHNEHVDRLVRLFLQEIGTPKAMDALAAERHAAEAALIAAETRYLDSQFRLAQLNQAAPEAASDDRAAIDAERHDLRHMLVDMPTDIEYAARKLFESENRIYQVLMDLRQSELAKAQQHLAETRDPSAAMAHKELQARAGLATGPLRRYEDPAAAAHSHCMRITQKYSNLQGVEAEFRRRKHADRDAERFPELVEEHKELSSAYDARQRKRIDKLASMFEEAFQDAERTLGEHHGIAADLEAMKRRGNTPVGFHIPDTTAIRDLDNLRRIERVMKDIKR